MTLDVVARSLTTKNRVRLVVEGGRLTSLGPAAIAEPESPPLWVAPAFWDIQTNGRWGISFSDETLTVDQVIQIVRANAALGTARLCPTLISGSRAAFVHGLRTIASACEQDPATARRVLGVHLEGPYLSEVDGYRGAHPLSAIREPDWDEFQKFQEAAGGRIVLLTIAPERTAAIAFIRRLVASGVVVSIGHTASNNATIQAAVAAGATLSTHLGNGVASTLARHPNPIWAQAGIDALAASFIADGHHLDDATLKVLVRAKTLARTILVSDASPLAGLPLGKYGDWEVDPSGKVVVAGTPYLAGSNQGLETGINTLIRATGCSVEEAWETVTNNPARLLGLRVEEADGFCLFERAGERIKLLGTCVDGEWTGVEDDGLLSFRSDVRELSPK